MTTVAVSGRITSAHCEPLCLRYSIAWDSGHVGHHTTHVRPAVLLPLLDVDDAQELVGRTRHGRIEYDAQGHIRLHHGYAVVLTD